MSTTKTTHIVVGRAGRDLCIHDAFRDHMVLQYLKNFVAKLLLTPILMLLGAVFLLSFVLLPQFKLFPEPRHRIAKD